MSQHKNELGQGTDQGKMDSHLKKTLDQYKGSADVGIEPVEDISHDAPPSGQHPVGPMKGKLMNWTEIKEAMEIIMESIESMVENPDLAMEPVEPDTSGSDGIEKQVLDELNKIFTPILVMQGFENGIAGQVQEAAEQANCLTERNIIQFDDQTRMAQLISTCAILLQKAKNTEQYNIYAKAAATRNQMKIEMQKAEYDAAKALAQKYLVMVSTTNNSPVARDAATALLPQTQH